MISTFRTYAVTLGVTLLIAGSFASIASANHSWGGYHWARTTNPFTLKLGDNVSSTWDSYLVLASSDWSVSNVLDATVVVGSSNPKNCRATLGLVQVCNSTYGNNGWLGVASVWISGVHIVQGTVKVNDTYFNTSSYNTPGWRKLVMCQEIGHTFGLDYQDTTFNNPNLGTCMDYTNDPDGTLFNQLSNEHPNAHDYEELGIIYSHLDTTTTVSASKSALPAVANDEALDGSAAWGKEIRTSYDGHNSLFERDLGKGNKIFTFVIWAKK